MKKINNKCIYLLKCLLTFIKTSMRNLSKNFKMKKKGNEMLYSYTTMKL